MTDQDQHQEPQRGARPSFSSFWKKGKDKLRGKEIKFVQQGTQEQQQHFQSSESPESSGRSPDNKQQNASDKAKIRRAQVRRAQIQHRQRKAEYVKQLELDVSHFRELISLTEIESEGLRNENETIRVKLRGAGVVIPASISHGQSQPTPLGADMEIDSLLNPDASLGTQPLNPTTPHEYGPVDNSPVANPDTPEMFANINIEDITVTLKEDPMLGTPVFNVSSSSGNSNHASPSASDGEGQLTPAQEHMAINFILALEHICWNHFWLGDFPGHHEHSEKAMGHTLMASTFCMADAPESVFMGRKAGLVPQTCKAITGPLGPPVNFQWSTAGISLDSLHNLALSLNPGDLELTPVQAWFELARRYSIDKLLDPLTLDALKREMNGVVKCLHFGAVIERQAFESVTNRVLGPP
ncbi:Fc.00g062380.m01.CDS01 [Cosmosporella sp. VM-42]